MALVPCTADTARRILAQTASTTMVDMAGAVTALRTVDPVVPAVERALHRALRATSSARC
ncbi:hypothetical protein J7F03_39100 [Streptomyces sp. ISL-43]|uniref:hypothetical protein n=1 Tax=Streptomyces sp. ISL-43 TaxID=2819183 RepID=UPI001BE57E2D|nr:hypothetical protein [Streptomyces sp. ISL-43]MBT2452937.1 hypothetical protein [Streptomyces sp. ISL-43]